MITLDIDEEIFLPRFRHLLNSDNDIEFLWGGRDSGKSHFRAQKFLLDCLNLKYFRCILVRKVFEDIKDSQWQLLKDQAESMGIDHFFKFNSSPLEIRCLLNQNKFIARGCDKPSKLKSISSPSHVWYEEGNQLTEQDYITISTTIRSSKGKVKEYFTLNPESEIDYMEFWMYNYFFKDHYEKGEYSFIDNIKIKLPDGKEVELKMESVHSTYHDNPFVTPERVARHEQLKITNPYYYQIFTLGLWGNRQEGGQIYKGFSMSKNIENVKYNSELVLHLTFDFNVNPYMTGTVWQSENKDGYKEAKQIDEILLSHPRNTSMAICAEFVNRYRGHIAGVFVYGDPQGLKQSTAATTLVRIKEKDYNEFDSIKKYLKQYFAVVELKVDSAYPSVVLRTRFINEILAFDYDDCKIIFGENCKRTHAEYSNLKEASDGTKFKEKSKDEITGVQCEKWGHISDANDYFLVRLFRAEFRQFERKGTATKESFKVNKEIMPILSEKIITNATPVIQKKETPKKSYSRQPSRNGY